jgi:hypothetical protein
VFEYLIQNNTRAVSSFNRIQTISDPPAQKKFRAMWGVSRPLLLADSSSSLPIIIGCIVGALFLILVILCICRMKCCKRYDSTMATVPSRTPQKPRFEAPGNLIPPVFLTEDMRDPLLQEDLREHLPQQQSRPNYV